jgi:hypothetical protein
MDKKYYKEDIIINKNNGMTNADIIVNKLIRNKENYKPLYK